MPSSARAGFFGGAIIAATVAVLSAQPNPYRRVVDWAQLPAGMTWAAVIGAEPGPDGNIYILHRCFENSCAGRTEPPLLKFNQAGKLLKAWGAGMFVFPHGFHIDRDGNVWVTDARAAGGKGHQVFKFSPDGKLLMTLGKAGIPGNGPDTFNEPTDVVSAPTATSSSPRGTSTPRREKCRATTGSSSSRRMDGSSRPGASPARAGRVQRAAHDRDGFARTAVRRRP